MGVSFAVYRDLNSAFKNDEEFIPILALIKDSAPRLKALMLTTLNYLNPVSFNHIFLPILIEI